MREACHCGCHKTLTGDIRAASQISDFWMRFDLAQKAKEAPNNDPPDVTDILAAAAACPACIQLHTPALLDHPTPRDKEPWIEPPRSNMDVTDGQADGDGPE